MQVFWDCNSPKSSIIIPLVYNFTPMEKAIYKQCQSCGMLFQTKKAGDCRGTEKDGSRSEKWCSLCYTNGEFVG